MGNIDVKRDSDLADDTCPVHSPSGVLAVSDILRRCLVHFSDNAVAGADVLRRDVEAAATSLSMQHMAMCRELGERSRSFFAAEFLIQCLLFSGWLKSQHSMLPALEDSISITVPFIKHREYLLDLIRSTHKPPSRTAMYKHRLMLVCGYCSHHAEANRRMFQQGDVVRFCTMDGSPQHGYDWLLHGSITISVAECVVLFYLAIEYIGLSLEQGPAPEDANNRTRELRARLSRSLCKVLNLPVAVGSGKAGIRHKLHSLVHSERMYCWSWAAAAAMVSRSFCWTGDLGCESSVTQCRVLLRKLFPWANDKSDTAKPPHHHHFLVSNSNNNKTEQQQHHEN